MAQPLEPEVQSQPQPKKVWASLITNLSYLPGLLTLRHSLLATGTAYPFVALYTPSFPPEGLAALRARNILTRAVPPCQPKTSRVYTHDPRFNEAWNKLVVFGLTEFERVVLLDGDMLVRKGMDELMDVVLDEDYHEEVEAGDGVEQGEKGKRVFAASHACACNPLKKAHYPGHWNPSNCAFTTQHADPVSAQTTPAPVSAGVSMLNSGLLVVRPSSAAMRKIKEYLDDPVKIAPYTFPDQELLSEAFQDRWVPLPYVYNALKTMRAETVHGAIWRDSEVKNVHYIFAIKPWQVEPEEATAGDVLNTWWWEANFERKRLEREQGIEDGY